MFIARTYLEIDPQGAVSKPKRPKSRGPSSTRGGRATKERVTEEHLDEYAQALASRLNNLVDHLPEEG